MASDPAIALDEEYPNLPREVLSAYRAAPPNVVAEVIHGALHTMPRPHPRHQSATVALIDSVSLPFRRGRGGPGGWIILPEPELGLGDVPDLLQPDLAGWRRERLAEVPETAAIHIAPDWVCEVLSSSTRRHDRIVKMPAYLRHGVGHAWLVDPEAHTLEVFRRTPEGWLLVLSAAGDEPVRAEPFDAIELDLGAFWQW